MLFSSQWSTVFHVCVCLLSDFRQTENATAFLRQWIFSFLSFIRFLSSEPSYYTYKILAKMLYTENKQLSAFHLILVNSKSKNETSHFTEMSLYIILCYPVLLFNLKFRLIEILPECWKLEQHTNSN